MRSGEPRHRVRVTSRIQGPFEPNEVVEHIDHPDHYGGDTVYEAIKVIEAWGLSFSLGSALKYIRRADHKGSRLHDLRKARWYIDHEIKRLEGK